MRVLVVSVLGMVEAASTQRSCASYWVRSVSEDARRLSKAKIRGASSRAEVVRSIAMNHKTGTYLSRCLVKVLAEVGVRVDLAPPPRPFVLGAEV